MSSQRFRLKWHDYLQNMVSVFKDLYDTESMVDVTLGCEGSNLKAHKVILSAYSPYFRSLFQDNPCQHPIVIIKDMQFEDLQSIIEFIYNGEVSVSQDKLHSLLKSADTLKIKGLVKIVDAPNGSAFTPKSTKRKRERRHSNSSSILQTSAVPKKKQVQIEEILVTEPAEFSDDTSVQVLDASVSDEQLISGSYIKPENENSLETQEATITIESVMGPESSEHPTHQLAQVQTLMQEQAPGGRQRQALLLVKSIQQAPAVWLQPSTKACSSEELEQKLRLIKCQQCDYTADYPCKIRRHMIIHSGERPHACHVCGKRFNRKENLKAHLIVHKRGN